MYAVIETGGKQYRVIQGQRLKVERLAIEAGQDFQFDKVLMVGEGDAVKVGKPYLTDTAVQAKIVEHCRGKKVRIIKFRRRKHSMKQMGHRQDLTEVEITGIPSS